MNESFLVSILCCLVMVTMIGLVKTNATLTNNQRNGIIMAFRLVMGIVLLEELAIVLNGTPTMYRPLHILVNYLGFTLSPLVVLSIIRAIVSPHKMRRYYKIALAYALFVLFQLPSGFLFYVDANNVYSRGICFFVFILIYLTFVLFLIKETLQMYVNYQKTGKVLLVPIAVMTLFGSSIQILNPNYRITWVAMTFVLIIYYTHCANLWNQIDGLTGLLSQKVFLRDLNFLSPDATVYVFDIDKFKELNDAYGHHFGDTVLIEVANILLSVYGKYGTCYRIGGDEMSVILNKEVDVLTLDSQFFDELLRRRMEKPYLPDVSLGCAVLEEGEDPSVVKQHADEIMYTQKASKL